MDMIHLQNFYRYFLLLAAAFLLTSCTGRYFHKTDEPPPQPLSLSPADWPVKEYWTGVVFNGTRVGFTHIKITPSEDPMGGYDIHSAAYLRPRLFMFDKEIDLIAYDGVAEDLTLVHFSYRYDLDGNLLFLDGKHTGSKLEVTVENRNNVSRQTINLKDKIYPTSVIGLYPFLHGLQIGRLYNYVVYDAQKQKLVPVTQEIVAYEKSDLYAGSAFKIITRMQDQKMITWMDYQGRPLLEMSMGGVIISAFEPKSAAERYLTSAALNKDEALLNFSLIETDKKISDPDHLISLSLEINGIEQTFNLPNDRRQHCRRRDAKYICRIDSTSEPAGKKSFIEDPDVLQQNLQPTFAITTGHPEIVKVAQEARVFSENKMEQTRALVDWIAANIEQKPVDVFTALDVLASGRSECQGHALLFAAMARTIGLPTRVVNGIVYSPALKGFVYHTWNECYLDGRWVAVDPTLKQLPAGATHLKIVEGHTPAELLPLVELIGKIDIRITELDYRN
jgi:hypothetical protein